MPRLSQKGYIYISVLHKMFLILFLICLMMVGNEDLIANKYLEQENAQIYIRSTLAFESL